MSEVSKKGLVIGVCLSHHRQAPKKNIGWGVLRKNWGLEGDSHAGTERQISLLASEDIETVCKEHNILAPPGSFAENITTRGIDLGQTRVGEQIRLGEATLQVVALGKDPGVPHTYAYCGISLLLRKGVFARVITGGSVRVGNTVELLTPVGKTAVSGRHRTSRSV